MIKESTPDIPDTPTPIQTPKSIWRLAWEELVDILYRIVNLRDTTDIKKTIDNIRKGVEIRGYNVWILACAAMLASIGLDRNSSAVIIGAMLISPLMSPILGIGLSMGINDREYLVLSLKNFAIAMTASILVSTLYFLATPLGAATEEILSRTQPDTLDVLVAIFGGIAGIVAVSRKEMTNAIPGVAIATALMPPLCVTGYGLAKGEWDIFAGAFYLFFINSVFIALSTYLIVRFLRFPYIDFVDEKTRRRTTTFMSLFVLLLIIPSFWFMVKSIQHLRRRTRIENFIELKIEDEKHRVTNYDYAMQGDSLCMLTIALVGPAIEEDSIVRLEASLANYQLEDTRLTILQSPESIDEQSLTSRTTLETQKAMQPQIEQLQAQMDSLKGQIVLEAGEEISWPELVPQVKSLYPELENFSLGEMQQTEFGSKSDTVLTVLAKWKRSLRASQRREKEKQMGRWLKTELACDTVIVISLP
ncbi:MAG: TIGR00341 family protein [Bacteroidota bacterium]